MAFTYDKIASTTLSSTQSDVTFSEISGSYTDLVLVCQPISTALATTYIRFNNDTTSQYSWTNAGGDGTSSYAGRTSNATFGRLDNGTYSATVNDHNIIANFNSYSNTAFEKTFYSRASGAGTNQGAEMVVGLWRSTNAITSIKIYPSGSASWVSGSTFTIYGILKA
jgi:hypothetical protein